MVLLPPVSDLSLKKRHLNRALLRKQCKSKWKHYPKASNHCSGLARQSHLRMHAPSDQPIKTSHCYWRKAEYRGWKEQSSADHLPDTSMFSETNTIPAVGNHLILYQGPRDVMYETVSISHHFPHGLLRCNFASPNYLPVFIYNIDALLQLAPSDYAKREAIRATHGE